LWEFKEDFMELGEKKVDGFRFLPPGLRAWIKTFIPEEDFKGYIPWTPIKKPLNRITFTLVTSAGVSLKLDVPFDMEREKKEPLWGDRSYRAIPRGTTKKISMSYCHSAVWKSLKRRGSLAVWPLPPILFMVFNGRIMIS
jgi:hypothetical protein